MGGGFEYSPVTSGQRRGIKTRSHKWCSKLHKSVDGLDQVPSGHFSSISPDIWIFNNSHMDFQSSSVNP